MTSGARQAGSRLLPVMQYRDVAGAIAWLCRAFGFEQQQAVRGPDGSILYAVVTFANAMIMLGPVRRTELDRLMKQPDEIGGAETQSCYLIVEDADAHFERAMAAGATVVFDLKEYDHGGRGYSCRDPEGHIWSFGTYDPWQTSITAAPELEPRDGNLLVPAGIAGLVLTIGVGAWLAVAGGLGPLFNGGGDIVEAFSGRQLAMTEAELDKEREARLRAESNVKEGREQLTLAQAETKTAELSARHWKRRLAQTRYKSRRLANASASALERTTKALSLERDGRKRAERNVQLVKSQRARERSARKASEQSLEQLRTKLAEEHRAREAAQRSAQDALDKLAAERKAATEAAHSAEAAARSAQELHQALALERSSKDAAESAAQTLRRQLQAERRAKKEAERKAATEAAHSAEAATRSAQELNQALALERNAKDAAESAAQTLRRQLQAERRAKEEAERSADAAQKRIAELQESTKRADATPRASPPPPPAKQRPAARRNSAGSVKRAPGQPMTMPAFIP